MKRRSFIKILAGAAALAVCPPAIAKLCNTEPVFELPDDATPFDAHGKRWLTDPWPPRFYFVKDRFEPIQPFISIRTPSGMKASVNQEWVNATREIEIWYSKSERKYFPVIVERTKPCLKSTARC